MKRILFLIFFIFGVFTSVSLGATTYYPQNASELNSSIGDAQSGDIIELNSSVTYILGDYLPEINTTLTINGNNATIDGNNTYDIFYINSDANLTLNNLVVSNAYGDEDAAVLSNNGGVANIHSCIFMRNERLAMDGLDGVEYGEDGEDGEDANGGVIYNNGLLNITDTLFLNNVAEGGSGGEGADAEEVEGEEEEAENAGNGGDGGDAHGVAIYNTSDATTSLRSMQLIGNEAVAGDGGFGGDPDGAEGNPGLDTPGPILYGIDFITLNLTNIDTNEHNITDIYLIDSDGTSINIAQGHQFRDINESITASMEYGHTYAIKFVLSDSSQWWYNYTNSKVYETKGKDEDFQKVLTASNNILSFDADDFNWHLDIKLKFRAQGGALEFSANGELVDLDTNFTNSDHNFTVEFWIKTTSESDKVIVFSKSDSASYIGIDNGKIDVCGVLSSVNNIDDNIWHHVAVVSLNDLQNTQFKAKIYIDGELDNNATLQHYLNEAEFESQGNTLNIGIKSLSGFSIDELRIWNEARDEGQIDRYKNAQILGNEGNLAGYYNFDEQNGNRVYDRGTFIYKGHLDENVTRINPVGIDAPKIYGNRFVGLRDTNVTIHFEVDNNKTQPEFSLTSPNADVDLAQDEIVYTITGNNSEDFNLTMSLADEYDISTYIKIISLNLPLNPPSNLHAEHSISSVRLTWNDNSNNEDGFNIVRYIWNRDDNSSIVNTEYVLKNGTEINNTIMEDSTSFTDTDIDTNKRYSYIVLADNEDGLSNSQSVDVSFDTNITLNISDLNLSETHISSIVLVGQNGSLRNIPVSTGGLVDGNNYIDLTVLDGFYAVRVILDDGSSWWYNYNDAMLYQTIGSSDDFARVFDNTNSTLDISLSPNRWHNRAPLMFIKERFSKYLSSVEIDGISHDIVISDDGNRAYVANGNRGLFIVDIEDPVSFSIMGTVEFNGYVFSLELSNDETKAYVVSGGEGLTVVDVSDPYNPHVTGHIDTNDNAIGIALSADNTKAYIADEQDGLIIIDINDSSSLSILGTLDINDTMIERVVLSNDGTKAYVTAWEHGLYSIDISDSTAPSVLGHVDIGGHASYLQISKDNTKVYVSRWGEGLSVIDISDPTSLSLLGAIDTGNGIDTDIKLSNDGSKIYIQNLFGNLHVIDVSDPTSLSVIKDIYTNIISYSFMLSHDETKLYISSFVGGLMSIDINSTKTSGVISDINLTGEIYTVKLSSDNNRVYAAGNVENTEGPSEENFHILDVTNPRFISALRNIGIDGHIRSMSISSDNKRMYIADGIGDFVVVDITDPLNPNILGEISTQGDSYGVAISEDETKAYIANGNAGLAVIDITNPLSMSIINTMQTNDKAFNVELSKDNTRLFITDNDAGLLAVDISDPNSLSVLGSVDTQSAYSLVLSDDNTKAYVGKVGDNGFVVVDISDPSSMVVLGGFNTKTHILSLKLSQDNNTLFVADMFEIKIIDVHNPRNPHISGRIFGNHYNQTNSFDFFTLDMELTSDEEMLYIANYNGVVNIDAILDVYLPKNFIEHDVNLTLSDFEGDMLNISVDINDTSIATIGDYNNQIDANTYRNQDISIPINSVTDATGVALVSIDVDDGIRHVVRKFYLKVYEAKESISLDISDLNLTQKDIKNIQYIGENENNETFIIGGSQNLVNGDNHLKFSISNVNKDFSLKFNLRDGRYYWYNFEDHKLYQDKNNTLEFIATATNRANNVFVLNANESNWILANTIPKVAKIYDLFVPVGSGSMNVSFMIDDEARNNLKVELELDGVIQSSRVFDYATYSSAPVVVSVEPSSNVNEYREYKVIVTSENNNYTTKCFNIKIIDKTKNFNVIMNQETQTTYDSISDTDFSGDLYSFNSYVDEHQDSDGVVVVEYKRHHVVNSQLDKEVSIIDTNSTVEFFEEIPSVPTDMKVAEAVSNDETTTIYRDFGMDFDFTNSDSKSQKVYVKFDDAQLMIFDDDDYYGREQNLTFESLEDFMTSVIEDNSHGLLRNFSKNKVLTIDKNHINDDSGVLIEKDQNGTVINASAGVWNKMIINGFETLVLYPTSNQYRYGEAFMLDDSDRIKFANYMPEGDIFSVILLNKEAKDELYHSLSPNPKIRAQLNNGYTYLSLPTSKLLCDEDVQSSYARCDQNNTLESVFGVNPDVTALFKYANGWMYWNSDVNASAKFIIPKYATLSPLDGVLVKTSAQTSVMIPFDEDSFIVNDYRSLFPEGWLLLSNNDQQTVEQISSALEAQGKELMYILVLRDGVWKIYAPTNDAEIDASIPRINVVRRYENYWVYFKPIVR